MRIKFVEILKFVVAVAIGFTLRVMFESSYSQMPREKPCFVSKDIVSDLSLDNIHEQLRQPHRPSSIRDVIEYRYFNLSVVFDTHLGHVKTEMKQYHRSDIRDIIKQVESLMNAGISEKYKIKSFINGFERIDPVRGKEYIVDLELTTDRQSISKIFRYSLIKPFSYAQMVSQVEVSPTKSKMINLIYILNGNDVKFIKSLLAHHEAHIINMFPVNVTIYFCSEIPLDQNVHLEVVEFSLKYKPMSSYKLNLIENDKNCKFRAPEITNKAVQLIDDTNARIIILDASVTVTHQFLQRCSSILSESTDNIYVPIPFARFLRKSTNQGDQLNEATGVWDHDNFEILCIRKKLFMKGNKLNEKEYNSKAYKSLLNRLIAMQKQVFRSTDPSVRIYYHNLSCKVQESLRFSNKTYCEDRQRKTFQSEIDTLNSIKLN